MRTEQNRIAILVYTGQAELAALKTPLAEKGFRLLTAENRAEALAVCRNHRPAIILVDPDEDAGTQIIESLKAADPEITIALLAHKKDIPDILTRMASQIDDVMLKPLDPDDIGLALHRLNVIADLRRVRKEAGDSEQIETERFLAVRQIVEKMSIFISQVAAEVDGGIRYFNELPYFVSIHSRDCRVLAANPTYLKYLGNRMYHNSWEVYVGKRATRESCPVGRTLKSGDVLETRALVHYLSGAKVPVLVHTAPILNNEGEIELVLEVFAGTKEIERLAEEARSTQQRYQQLFDAVPSQIVVVDRHFRINAANRRFKEAFGDHIGQNLFKILRPGSFPAYHDPINQTIKDGMPHQGEMVLTDRKGIQYNIHSWTAPLKTAGGKLLQVLVIFTDITEQRRLQDNLSFLGLMVSMISHDLKGSITGLDAGLYLIDTGFYRDQPGRIEEGLEVSKLMVERIRKLVNDILYSAKERPLEPEIVDVEHFLGDVAANMENRIKGADIEFDCDFGENLDRFEIDVKLLRSALINILENALEACIEDTRKKAFTISFKAKPEADHISLEICDNAHGMDPDTKRHLFDPFYSSKGQQGTGLGLYITRRAIQKHGGTISVVSEPGQGACFEIRIPRKTAGIRGTKERPE